MVSSDDDEDKTEAESDELEEMKKVRFWMQYDFFGSLKQQSSDRHVAPL
jgi:hypothetical protein